MASRLQDVIGRGLAADRPPANEVANGTLYYSTDTAVTERSNGVAWESYTDAGGGGGGGPHASTHAVAGSDPVNLDQSQIINLSTDLAAKVSTTDPRLTDARTPTSHASSHMAGGVDKIKLDDLEPPDDNTDLNASITKHGLLPKLPNDSTKYLNGIGGFTVPPGGGGTGDVVGPASSVNNDVAVFDGTTGKLIKDGGKVLPTGAIVGTTDVQTLTNKTLTSPVIGDFGSAQHAHTYAGTGGQLVEIALSLTDNATNDVTTGRHGFVPKAPNDATKFLNGLGAWSVPPAGGGGTPGGSTGQVQFNNAGAFAGDAEFTYALGQLTVDMLRLDVASPNLTIHDTSAGVDQKQWRIIASATDLYIAKYNDTNSYLGTVLSIARSGVVTIAAGLGSTPLNATQLTSGTIPDARLSSNILRRQITLVIDGGTSVITTGFKTYISLPSAGTLKKWRILADVSGSIVIDVWKDTYANYPPTVGDTITASAKPTLSSALKAESSALTGWTTAFAAGDVLGFNVDSVTSVKKISLVLEFE